MGLTLKQSVQAPSRSGLRPPSWSRALIAAGTVVLLSGAIARCGGTAAVEYSARASGDVLAAPVGIDHSGSGLQNAMASDVFSKRLALPSAMAEVFQVPTGRVGTDSALSAISAEDDADLPAIASSDVTPSPITFWRDNTAVVARDAKELATEPNAAPSVSPSAVPLLIPLPSSLNLGLWGLVAMALAASVRRLRRAQVFR